jgi:hypothetical protein
VFARASPIGVLDENALGQMPAIARTREHGSLARDRVGSTALRQLGTFECVNGILDRLSQIR